MLGKKNKKKRIKNVNNSPNIWNNKIQKIFEKLMFIFWWKLYFAG